MKITLRGCNTGIRIEPPVVVTHAAPSKAGRARAMRQIYFDHDRRLEKMIAEIKTELKKP